MKHLANFGYPEGLRHFSSFHFVVFGQCFNSNRHNSVHHNITVSLHRYVQPAFIKKQGMESRGTFLFTIPLPHRLKSINQSPSTVTYTNPPHANYHSQHKHHQQQNPARHCGVGTGEEGQAASCGRSGEGVTVIIRNSRPEEDKPSGG